MIGGVPHIKFPVFKLLFLPHFQQYRCQICEKMLSRLYFKYTESFLYFKKANGCKTFIQNFPLSQCFSLYYNFQKIYKINLFSLYQCSMDGFQPKQFDFFANRWMLLEK